MAKVFNEVSLRNMIQLQIDKDIIVPSIPIEDMVNNLLNGHSCGVFLKNGSKELVLIPLESGKFLNKILLREQ